VLVPFSGQKLCGVVVRVHGDKPEYETKQIQQVLDREALLTDELMELARWLATYYVAPLGEVLRGMLPLTAEVKRQVVYALAEGGRRAKGRMFEDVEEQPARSAEDEAEQVEREVLRYLAEKGPTRLEKLRSATGAAKKHLDEMVKRRWLARESVAETRDARRLERVAALVPDARLPKLNENQQLILAELAAAGGTMTVRALRELAVPETTLGTLVRRGLVRMDEVPESFVMSTLGKAGQATHEHELNAAQQKALDEMVGAMGAGRFSPHLLYGVTGSGKTAVYLAAMRKALDAGRSAILLVPEIGLTPSMAGQLYAAFGGEVALLHSALTPDERAEQWHRIRRGEAWVVVGTRSAVFAPAVRLGLIIVDEEHDNSYKQEETPRYHGRDTAVMRAKLNEAVVVMGSATPSLESWANASSGKYKLMALNERVMERPLPTVELVDMRREFQETGTEALFSRKLVEETEATLQRGEQAIILLNRRG